MKYWKYKEKIKHPAEFFTFSSRFDLVFSSLFALRASRQDERIENLIKKNYSVKAFVQTRDLLDKGIEILEGDFFSFGSTFFEIVTAPDAEIIAGQIEHKSFTTITGKQARKGQFLSKVLGPTSEEYTDKDAIQNSFYQQRGFENNKLGKTADKRSLIDNGVLEKPITKPKEISTKAGKIPGFYDE